MAGKPATLADLGLVEAAVELLGGGIARPNAGAFINPYNRYGPEARNGERASEAGGGIGAPGMAGQMDMMKERAGNDVDTVVLDPGSGEASADEIDMAVGEESLPLIGAAGAESSESAAPGPAVSVIGAVRNPGRVEMRPGEQWTLLQVLAATGGFDKRANQTRIELKRGEETRVYSFEKLWTGEEAVTVQPGDVIRVRESFF